MPRPKKKVVRKPVKSAKRSARASATPTGSKKSTSRSSKQPALKIPLLRWPEELLAAAAKAADRPRDQVVAFKSEMKERLKWSQPFRRRSGGLQALEAQAVAVAAPRPDGVVGVGFGAKISEGRVVARECVRVYVERKRPKSELSAAACVPESINGMPTDVIEAPEILAQAVLCGVSVGHPKITAGTIGCLVKKNGRRFILSNNHVIANCNVAAVGDAIWQPGPKDGGKLPAIAQLSEFRQLDFSGAANAIDAAIAQLVRAGSVKPKIRLVGTINPTLATATSGLAVKKCGRTTDLTSGHVEGLSEDVKVSYGKFGTAYFEDQVAVRGSGGLFSKGGDSGSLIVTADGNQALALLFAGDATKGLTFASPLAGVLSFFGVTIVS